ncbi:MAG: InlB B-repeat-containing protein [Clostridia bacterium]|nr:InlB B-repeat-containing protein [Clostridia bacterium]
MFGYPYYQTFAENAAGDYKTPTAVMDGWMNSAGHKATLMRDDFTAVGVGCVKMGGYTYWIQIFAGPSKGAGGDYEIIESTYSGSQLQTFTISIYESYLDYFLFDTGAGGQGIRVMVGKTSSDYLRVTNAREGQSLYKGVIVPTDVPDVKDESTGEVIATTSVAADGAVTITATAAGTGYLYLYAYEGASPKIVKIITYRGKTVTFDSCGGSSVSSQTVEYYAKEPEAPTRSGYTFAGWYTAADGGTEYEFDEGGFLRVESDVTLYAHWTANTTSTTTKAEETTTAAPETTAASETTTTKSEETTTSPTEAVTEETTAEPDEETTAPDETTGTPDESETTEPDETTGEVTDDVTEGKKTDDFTDTTGETGTEITETETQTENTSEKSDTDSAAVANNGESGDNGNNVADEENGTSAWIVVLVVVLFIAAAGVTVFVVLKRNKSVGETADTAESAETENDNVENDSTDDNTGGDDE